MPSGQQSTLPSHAGRGRTIPKAAIRQRGAVAALRRFQPVDPGERVERDPANCHGCSGGITLESRGTALSCYAPSMSMTMLGDTDCLGQGDFMTMWARPLPLILLIGCCVGCSATVTVGDANRVEVFDTTGHFIRSIGSNGSRTVVGETRAPMSVAVDTANGGNIVVIDVVMVETDEDTSRVAVFSASGTLMRLIGQGHGNGEGQLSGPRGVAVDVANESNIIVADTYNDRVEVFSANGTFIRTVGKPGSGDGQLRQPWGVAVDTANNSNIIVADGGNDRIVVFSAKGTFIRTIGKSGNGDSQLSSPAAVAVDTANNSNVIVADPANHRVEVFTQTGTFVRTIGTHPWFHSPLDQPNGVAVDIANGSNVVIADYLKDRVEVYSAEGSFVRSIGSNSPHDGLLSVAVDTSNGSNVIVAASGYPPEYGIPMITVTR